MKVSNKYLKLFEKYLSGNCSDDEKALVKNYLNQNPELKTLFDEYNQIWNFSGNNDLQSSIDVDADWEELNRRINAVESISIELEENKFFISRKFVFALSRIAAVFIVAFGLLFFFNNIKNNQPSKNVTYTAADILNTPLVLADGSEVLLNKGAEIEYPEVFASDSRKINFVGNAYFNVAHNADKPFIIDCGELRVEVLGTSFNLCTCPQSDEMVLYLESGKVRFSSINTNDGSVKEQLILTPGQKGSFNKKTGLISRSEIKDRNYLAWKTGLLVFDKTSLDVVIATIEQTYNLKVDSNKSFEDMSLTARFDNETPESIFESLHTIFGIQYSISGKNVILN